MPTIEARFPGQGTEYVPVVITSTTTSTTTPEWASWTTTSVAPIWTTTPCTTTLIPITTPCTTTVGPVVPTSPSEVIVVHHPKGGLSPGVVGAIVIGAFFGVLLLFLLCLWCFRVRRRPYYGDDDDSDDSGSRRRRRPKPIDPYPDRRGMTFVGGGNQPGTRVVVTRSQRMFIRPPAARRVETTRKERIVVVDR